MCMFVQTCYQFFHWSMSVSFDPIFHYRCQMLRCQMFCHYCLPSPSQYHYSLSWVMIAFTTIARCTVISPPLMLPINNYFLVHHPVIWDISFVHSPSSDSKSRSLRCYIGCRHQSDRHHNLFVLNEESEVEFFGTFHQNVLFWHFTHRLVTSFWICAAIYLSNEKFVIEDLERLFPNHFAIVLTLNQFCFVWIMFDLEVCTLL